MLSAALSLIVGVVLIVPNFGYPLCKVFLFVEDQMMYGEKMLVGSNL
jgi:hypothetical protein